MALARTVRGAWETAGRPAWELRHPTSDLGLTTAERHEADEVLAPISLVQHRVVYETRAPAGLAEALAPHVRGAWAVTFASPSAVEHLLSAARDAAPPVAVECSGQSTLRRWEARRPPHWPHAVLTEPP